MTRFEILKALLEEGIVTPADFPRISSYGYHTLASLLRIGRRNKRPLPAVRQDDAKIIDFAEVLATRSARRAEKPGIVRRGENNNEQ